MKLIVAEPPAEWRVVPPLVADCNLLAALLFHEPQRDDAEARLADREIHAPTLCAGMSVRLHGVDLDEVLGLAGRYELSAYDAAYLWLAADLHAPLATFDRKLGQAAVRHLGSLS